MALEIENNLVAALRYDGVGGVIVGQYGIAGVVKSAPGLYIVQTLEGLGVAEGTTACSVEPPDPVAEAVINHRRIDDTHHEFAITSPLNGALTDAPWTAKFYRCATGTLV